MSWQADEKPSTGKTHKKRKKKIAPDTGFSYVSPALPWYKTLREIYLMLRPYEEQEFAGKKDLVQRFKWLCIAPRQNGELARYPSREDVHLFQRASQKHPELRGNEKLQNLIGQLIEK